MIVRGRNVGLRTTHKGWTSEGLDCIYTSKEKAMKALIHAFGGEFGDCGFRSDAEILRTYPLTYNVWKKPLYQDKDNLKCYNEIA